MKSFSILLFLFSLNACSSYSQKQTGRIIIDKELEARFFENPPMRAQEGSLRVYTDSILVESNDSINNWDIVINSYIKEINRTFPMFDSCKSFFYRDTLIIEFKDVSKFILDKIKIKVINDTYTPFYIKGNDEYIATPISLKFKNKIEKKGQEIIGELEIDFQQPNTNLFQSFKGPFRCIVE
jgi:hypothetical protein